MFALHLSRDYLQRPQDPTHTVQVALFYHAMVTARAILDAAHMRTTLLHASAGDGIHPAPGLSAIRPDGSWDGADNVPRNVNIPPGQPTFLDRHTKNNSVQKLFWEAVDFPVSLI